MEGNLEDDHRGVQQDIQQIHRLLGEREEEEEEDEEEDDDEADDVEVIQAIASPQDSQVRAASSQLQPSEGSIPATPVPPDTRHLEPSAENLLQLNLSYQDHVCTLLDNIKAARRKNHEIQHNVSQKTTIFVKGSRPISHFHKNFFAWKGIASTPLNEETEQLRTKDVPNPFTPTPKSWTADEDRALFEGVRNDGLQRAMKPLMDKQELLYERRRGTEDEERRNLTREINDIIEQLENMNTNAVDEELIGERIREMDWLKIASLHLNGERTEIECQLRWQNVLHPAVNKKSWSRKEELELDDVVEQAHGRDWQDIATKHGYNRSPFDCFSNYQKREILAYVRRPYSQEEDELIPELVERFTTGNFIHFHKVAYFMDQRIPQLTLHRWKKLNPQAKSGFWTKEEDELLMKGLKMYGMKWAKLTEVVKGRHASQIRDRWMYTLNPATKKGMYTLKEDIVILESCKRFGVGSWVDTARELNEVANCARTPNSVLHRFNSLFHRFFKVVKGIRLQEGSSFEILNSMSLDKILDEMIEYRQSEGDRYYRRSAKRRHDKLYNRKRRIRPPPSPLLGKNASFAVRKAVSDDLNHQLVDAIKPTGWSVPSLRYGKRITGTGSREARTARRHRLFTILMKALAVNTEGRALMLASMTTNAAGVRKMRAELNEKQQAQGPGTPEMAKTKDATSKEPVVSSKATTSKEPAISSKATTSKELADPSKAATSKELADPSKAATPKELADSFKDVTSKEPAVSSGVVTSFGSTVMTPSHPSTRAAAPKTVKVLQMKVTKRADTTSTFGQGTIEVPGKGYLVPVQNFLSSLGQGVPPSAPVANVLPPQIPQNAVPPVANVLPPQIPQTAVPPGQHLLTQLQPPSLSALPGGIVQQPFGLPAANQLTVPLGHSVPGGYLIPIQAFQQPFQSLSIMPTAGTAPGQLQTPLLSSGPGGIMTSTGLQILQVQGPVPKIETLNIPNAGQIQTPPTAPGDISSDVPMTNGNKLPSSTDQPSASTSKGSPKGQKERRKRRVKQVLPFLPPNEATISGFKRLLLSRKQIETNAKKTISIRTFGKRFKDADKGVVRGSANLLEELCSDECPNKSSMPADEAAASGSPVEDQPDQTLGDGSQQASEQNGAPTKTKPKATWMFSRSKLEYADVLENIRKSGWYGLLQQRFLSLFLWPALLSVLKPHRKRLLVPNKKKKKKKRKKTKGAAQEEQQTPRGRRKGRPKRGTTLKRKREEDMGEEELAKKRAKEQNKSAKPPRSPKKKKVVVPHRMSLRNKRASKSGPDTPQPEAEGDDALSVVNGEESVITGGN